MTQINPNINQYNNIYQGNTPQSQPVRIPNYYYVPDNFEPKSVQESLKENPMYDLLLKPFIEHPLAVLGTWLGLGVGFDAYSKACSGKYENSLPAKAARLGDKIQQSKLIQNKPVDHRRRNQQKRGQHHQHPAELPEPDHIAGNRFDNDQLQPAVLDIRRHRLAAEPDSGEHQHHRHEGQTVFQRNLHISVRRSIPLDRVRDQKHPQQQHKKKKLEHMGAHRAPAAQSDDCKKRGHVKISALTCLFRKKGYPSVFGWPPPAVPSPWFRVPAEPPRFSNPLSPDWSDGPYRFSAPPPPPFSSALPEP